MPYAVSIASAPVEILNHTLVVDESTSVRHVARFRMQSATGTYRPNRRDEVVVLELNGTTRKFGGLVNLVEEMGVGGEPVVPIELNVDCVSFELYADWVHVINGGFPEGTTLHFALTSLVAGLAGFGVTLDPSQPNPGPTLTRFEYDVRSYTSILDEIAASLGMVWEIDYNKVLRMYVPGTGSAAPFNVTDLESDVTFADITVEGPQSEYANKVIGRFGNGTREIIDVLTGDGSTVAFPIGYFPLIGHRGYITRGGTVTGGIVTGGVVETLSVGLGPGFAQWDYDPATGIVTDSLTPLRGVPLAIGEVAQFQYTAQFPVAITASIVASPVIETTVNMPEIFDRATAQATLDNALASLTAEPRTVRYSTYQVGLHPGMTQTVTVAKRNLSAVAGYITDVTVSLVEGDICRYDVVWLEGTTIQNTWRDTLIEWAQDTGGGGTSIAGGGSPTPGSGAAAPPPNAVQFNRAGGFGGDAAFTYDEDTNCLVMGDGSSITATIPESCAIIGKDCTITD